VAVGPINRQATEVLELLTDPKRCQVLLVTMPEETPVNELVETAFNLEDKVGISLGPVVVNGVYPEYPGLHADPEAAAEQGGSSLRDGEAEALAAAADFRLHRIALQREQVERLAQLIPLPQIILPFLFDADLGPAAVETLADHLLEGIEALPDLSPATP
jgi:anion-transporting  ArsA/GET3 family ATPase